MGTRGAYHLAEMVDGWTGEKRLLARLANWQDEWNHVGHYAQMVWAGTTRVGCALPTGRGEDVIVCRYSPAGNVMGRQPYAGRAIAR